MVVWKLDASLYEAKNITRMFENHDNSIFTSFITLDKGEVFGNWKWGTYAGIIITVYISCHIANMYLWFQEKLQMCCIWNLDEQSTLSVVIMFWLIVSNFLLLLAIIWHCRSQHNRVPQDMCLLGSIVYVQPDKNISPQMQSETNFSTQMRLEEADSLDIPTNVFVL